MPTERPRRTLHLNNLRNDYRCNVRTFGLNKCCPNFGHKYLNVKVNWLELLYVSTGLPHPVTKEIKKNI